MNDSNENEALAVLIRNSWIKFLKCIPESKYRTSKIANF